MLVQPIPAAVARRISVVVEVQTCGRRGHRAARAREHRLIPLAIVRLVGAVDVRRKRNVADQVDGCIQIRPKAHGPRPKFVASRLTDARAEFALGPGPWALGLIDAKPHDSPAEKLPRENLADDAHAGRADWILEHHARTRFQLLARMHERAPFVIALALEQQALDGAAARIATAEQPRRKHARVVGDEAIAGGEERRQIGDRRFVPAFLLATDDKKPRGAARTRMLRDELRREFEIEVRDAHQPATNRQSISVNHSAMMTGMAMTAPKTSATTMTNA